jgi:hypothetical protein
MTASSQGRSAGFIDPSFLCMAKWYFCMAVRSVAAKTSKNPSTDSVLEETPVRVLQNASAELPHKTCEK